MLYILAIFLPPLAVLLCGRPGAAILNLVLCLLFWIPGVVHAFIVIGQTDADRRQEKLIKELRKQAK